MRHLLLVVLCLTLLPFTVMTSTAQDDGTVPITIDNASEITRLASLTNGHVDIATWSPDGTYLLITGSMGLEIYESSALDSPIMTIKGVFTDVDFLETSATIYSARIANIDQFGNAAIVFELWDIESRTLIDHFEPVGSKNLICKELAY